jgi:hypothetical protein
MAGGATSTAHLLSLLVPSSNPVHVSSKFCFPIERSNSISLPMRRLCAALMSSGLDGSKLIRGGQKYRDFSVSAMSDGVTDCLDELSLKPGKHLTFIISSLDLLL